MNQTNQTPTTQNTLGATALKAPTSALLNIQDVAAVMNCSVRSIYRLVDARRIPQPVKLGAMLRWVKADFEQWIAAGCPDCRKR